MEPEKASTRMKTKKTKLRSVTKTGKLKSLFWIWNVTNQITSFSAFIQSGYKGHAPNLVPRSRSVTGNVRSGNVQQYTTFHWLLKRKVATINSALWLAYFVGHFRRLSREFVNNMERSCPVLNKCRLCGKTAQRKVLFLSDSGKILQLKKIIKKICDICVNATDELPKFSCRSCCDKLVRLNKSVKEFAALCKSAQISLEIELHPEKRGTGQKLETHRPALKNHEKCHTQWSLPR